MESSKNIMRNVVPLLRNREIGGNINKQRHQFTERLITSLTLEGEFPKDGSSVSSMNWNYNGGLLAVASTDGFVCITDPFLRKTVSTLIPTPSQHNITSVRFVGDSHDSVATASRAGVIVQNWSNTPDRPLRWCNCHPCCAELVDTVPGEPHLLWSAGNTGYVLRHDLRVPHYCFDPSSLIINVSYTSSIKCMAVNPKRSYYVAVGCNGSFVRLYDIRMVRKTHYNYTPTPHFVDSYQCNSYDPSCVEYYAPGNLARSDGFLGFPRATSIAFNASGSEMLVSYWPELMYIFDINKPRYNTDMIMNIPQTITIDTNQGTSYCCENISSVHAKEKRASCACYYMKRAKQMCKRNCIGDFYDAARNYFHVIKEWPNNKEAYLGLILCLVHLKWHQEAAGWLEYFRKLNPQWENHEKVVHVYNELKASREKWGDKTSFRNESSDIEEPLMMKARDYEQRFCGQLSAFSKVKFLGEEGKYICVSSDKGMVFIWDRDTSKIIHCLRHQGIVTNVQPHPSACLIATGGWHPAVKLWSPLNQNKP